MMAGGEDKWWARPFVSNSNCFVVPPMKFAEESCITMEARIRCAGMPMLLLSGRPVPGDGAGAACHRHRAGRRRAPGRRRLCQRHGARPSGDLRHLAFRLRPEDGRHVRRLGRAGAADGRLRADAPVLRPAGWGCGRHRRFQAAGHAGRLGAGDLKRHGRTFRAQHGLRGGRHACLAARLLPESLVLGDDLLGQVQRCVAAST